MTLTTNQCIEVAENKEMLKTKERPILFSAEMVRAILEGRKTQTRRIATKDESTTKIYWAKNAPVFPPAWRGKKADPYTGWVKQCGSPLDIPIKCPYGDPGDRLWVRETWIKCLNVNTFKDNGNCVFRADSKDKRGDIWHSIASDPNGVKWKPSIHMPRWASRINLEVTKVRVQRLQDISEPDALAEGIKSTAIVNEARDDYTGQYASEHYQELWDSMNEKRGYGWDKNPWVWVVEFKVLK